MFSENVPGDSAPARSWRLTVDTAQPVSARTASRCRNKQRQKKVISNLQTMLQLVSDFTSGGVKRSVSRVFANSERLGVSPAPLARLACSPLVLVKATH